MNKLSKNINKIKRDKDVFVDFISGFYNGIRFYYGTMLNKPSKPIFLDLMLTSKCNAKCLMCNIWCQSPTKEHSTEDIKAIFTSPVLSNLVGIQLGGGEPFLYRKLEVLFNEMKNNLPRLRFIVISTNGLLTEIITNEIKRALEILPNNVKIVLGVSIDGFKKTHDLIRGVDGIHEKAIGTIDRLKRIKDSRLLLQAHVTISPMNINEIDELNKFLKKYVEKVAYFPVVVSDSFFGNLEGEKLLNFTNGQKSELIRLLVKLRDESGSSPRGYYYSNLIEMLNRGNRSYPCTAGYSFIHIDYNGNVKVCPFLPDDLSLGKLNSVNIDHIWYQGKEIRKKLYKYEECLECTSDCDLYTITRCQFYSYFSFAVRKAVNL